MADKTLSGFLPPKTAAEFAAFTDAVFYFISKPGTGTDGYDDAGIDKSELVLWLQSALNLANASTTVKGVVEEGTQAELQAGTETGGTGARLFFSAQAMLNVFATAGQNANVLYVSSSNAFASDSYLRADAIGRVSKPFATIQAAVSEALDGDTVCVLGGTYAENITVTFQQNVSFCFLFSAALSGNITYPGPFVYAGGKIYSDGTGKITGNITFHETSNWQIFGFNTIDGQFLSLGGNGLVGLNIENCNALLNTTLNGVGGGLKNIGLITFTTLLSSVGKLLGDIRMCTFVGTRFSSVSNASFRELGKFYDCKFEFTGGNFGSFGQETHNYFFKNCQFKTDQNFVFDLHVFAPGNNYIQFLDCDFVAAANVVGGNQATTTIQHSNCNGNVPFANASYLGTEKANNYYNDSQINI